MTLEHPLLARAREAPEKPGIYRFKDAGGTDVYVGKARHIRRRVLSYFGRSDLPDRTRAMLDVACALDFTVTASEVEALILENTLIKRLHPRFNVMLRDDKTYPYLKVTTGEEWPRVFLTRRVRSDDGHTYFGPFMGQHMARRLMDMARTHFQVRTCHIEIDGKLARPCLYYHMKSCLAPCVDGLTTKQDYDEAVDELRLFLLGRHKELLPRLERTMWMASERDDFELAARYRDVMAIVRRLGERQDVEMPGKGDADVFAVVCDGEHATVCVLPYREGKLIDKREFHFDGVGDPPVSELLATFIAQFYESNPAIPAVLDTAQPLDDEERAFLEVYLSRQRSKKVEIATPQRGPRLRRIELAMFNARAAFDLRFRAPRSQALHLERRLGEALGLGPVKRIECFDISHASGKDTTASCVVWQSGRMEKKLYRTFNIKSVDGIDDFASIAEAVSRRYKRLHDEGKEMPDLVLIDGGLGQLNAAMAAVDTLGITVELAGLAKREELVWLPGAAEGLRFDNNDPAHLVLRQVRDEAHRFAVSRSRKRRRKRTLATELLNVPGIGPGRAKALLTRFGSVKGVQEAGLEDLKAALGKRLGAHVFQHLHAGEGR